jgi:TetR/AcrR family transcriptional regulator, cholesterol catabolism regulator
MEEVTTTETKLSAILDQAEKLFLRFGIKSLTMDDIANELKMSKKTLYQFVSDKQDLVAKTMQNYCRTDKEIVLEICGNSKNAIDELLDIIKYVKQRLSVFHPSIMYDLEKYYPEAWDSLHKHQKEFIYDIVRDNIMRGKNEDLYKTDVNEEIIARIYANRLDVTLDRMDKVMGKYDFITIYTEMMKYHIRGIASDKGNKVLNLKLKSLIS